MRPYDATHLSIIGVTIALAVLLARLCRQGRIPTKPVRYTLAAILVLEEVTRYAYFPMQFPNQLPIHLCTVTLWMVVYGCLTLSTVPVEFAYYTGMIGAGMALLTPDLPKQVQQTWPSYPGVRYFVEHAGIVLAVAVLVFGRLVPLRRESIWRTYGMLWVCTLGLGWFNWQFGTNYMFLCRKPKNPSLLDVMGPWPFYILVAALICPLFQYALWWPARAKEEARTEPIGEGSGEVREMA